MKQISSLIFAQLCSSVLSNGLWKEDDSIIVEITVGEETKELHYTFDEWLDMQGDEIFGLFDDQGEDHTGLLKEEFDLEDEFWDEIEDDWDLAADFSSSAAFRNQVGYAEQGPDDEHPCFKCEPERGTCRPQCPTAVWNYDRRKVEISWIEDIEGCTDEDPISTIIVLTPLIDGKFPDNLI